MVDYIFVQGVQFLTTISHELKFRTAEALPITYKKGTRKEDILTGVNKVIKLYESRVLIMEQIHGENEFECIREEIRPTLLNISAADEHVSMIERSIRTIKERKRSQVQYLPYNKYPRTLVIGCDISVIKINIKSNDLFRRTVGSLFTQLSKVDKYAQVSVNEGIRRHGDKAVAAVLAEFSQLNDKGVFRPRKINELNTRQRSEALNLITMVKEKRDGKIKGRACADGRKQRRYINRDEVSSPTVQLESLMISLLIDAHKRRDVAMADVTGAYLLANMNDFVLVKISGSSVDIMCKVNTMFKQYVCIEKGRKVLYLQLTKALYGYMQSALLWYDTFKGCLMDMGFTINPYDPCVANKVINNNQCTICWYVDDTKISHHDSRVVDAVILPYFRYGWLIIK